jgi:hypothetical protein
MDIRTDDHSHSSPSEEFDQSRSAPDRPTLNGAANHDVPGPPVDARHPVLKRAVTPTTFKLDETPEERDARVREMRAVLESLRARSPEEEQEQRETMKFLIAALNEGRAPYPKLFADRDDG